MWSIFVVSILICTAGGAFVRPDTGTELLGNYTVLFVSPKTNQHIPNCSTAPVSYAPGARTNFSCECGRADNNLAILQEHTRYFAKTILFDIVKTTDETDGALSDSCVCKPVNLPRVVAMKLNDNLLLQYEQKDNILRYFIFGKEIPSDSELRSAIANIKDLKYEHGQILCSNNNL